MINFVFRLKPMKEFKPVLIFLLKLVVSGLILAIIYNIYLWPFHAENKPDPYSQTVAKWTVSCLNTAGFESHQSDDPTRPWTWIYMYGQKTSYINEGCNAISIMIIFVAFVIAFSTTWKQTILYILGGLVVIQMMNILRIALLNYIFAYHPDFAKMAHDYLFPAILYGTIVVLWIIWVKYFALKPKKKSDEQVA